MSTKELRGTCKIAIGKSHRVIRSGWREHTPEELSVQSVLMGGIRPLRERPSILLTNRRRTWLKWRERLVGAGLLILVGGLAALVLMAYLAYESGA
jgi:hypothetical protein